MWIRVHRHTLVSSTDYQCLILETNFIIQAGTHAALAIRILLAKDVISSCLLFCKKTKQTNSTPLFCSDNFSCFVLLSHTCFGKKVWSHLRGRYENWPEGTISAQSGRACWGFGENGTSLSASTALLSFWRRSCLMSWGQRWKRTRQWVSLTWFRV